MSKLKTYLFSYEYAGAQYSFEIRAHTAYEAQDRLARLVYAKYDGEMIMKIPAPEFVAKPLARLLNWLGL
jgi:hypothetical protein